MNDSLQNILHQTATYVEYLLPAFLPKSIVYHDLIHTKEVVSAAKIVGEGNQLSEKDLTILLLAAWFHDTGHVVRSVGHEAESKRLAFNFLEGKLRNEEIKEVLLAIDATIMPQTPKSLIGKCLCDADLFNLSQPAFYKRSLLLREEWKLLNAKVFTDQEWSIQNLAFLEHHQYHTDFATQHCHEGKMQNINEMRKYIGK
jgi:predicted metal-dependent HD superfamily phosphohydrolase